MGNIISQEARKRQAIVKYALKKGKSKAAAMYGVSLSSIKRWCKRYDGTWQSLKEKSHRPHHHPSQHTQAEEKMIYHNFTKYLHKTNYLCYNSLGCLFPNLTPEGRE